MGDVLNLYCAHTVTCELQLVSICFFLRFTLTRSEQVSST